MDPNETLRRLRALLGGDHSGTELDASEIDRLRDHGAALLNDLCEAEELFQALDGWLTKDGAFPRAWHTKEPGRGPS